MKKILLFFTIFLIISIKAQHETAVWLSVQYPIKISEKLELTNDVGYRFKGENIEFYQQNYRTGLRYYFNKNTSSAVGFALFFTDNNLQSDTKKFGTEFRIWEDANFQKKFGSLKGVLRLRGEQRFFDDYGKKPSYSAFRPRFMLQLNKIFNEHFTLQISNEYLYQFKGGTSGFDQYRIAGNLLYSPTKKCEIKAGYMEIFLPERKFTDTFLFGISRKL